MKIKHFLTQTYLVGFLILTFSAIGICATIPPGTVILDNQRAKGIIGGPPTTTVVADENCNVIFNAYVYVTNLDPVWESNNTVGYRYPSGTTPIYFYYNISGATGIMEIPETNFIYPTFNGGGFNDPQSGLPIYEAKLEIPINFSDLCYADINTGIQWHFALVKANGDPYPYSLHNETDDIYSCLVFCENCFSGEEEEKGGCVEDVYFQNSNGVVNVNCNQCALEFDDPKGNSFFQQNSDMDIQNGKVAINQMEVSPNPTSNFTNLSFEAVQSGMANVSIYDASGREVLLMESAYEQGQNNFGFQTEQFQNGLYFGKVQIGEEMFTFKFVKI